MKRYIYLVENVIHEIIPEYVDIFPNVPITDRYSKSFLDQCKIVDEATEVKQNYIYNPETETFEEPQPIIDETIESKDLQ